MDSKESLSCNHNESGSRLSFGPTDIFIDPNVTLGDGTVVGTRSTTFKDVHPWKGVEGNPSKVIRVFVSLGS